jgi:succinate-semialdehyde dehydrogenase/glutarate-semialdehyde dehydrogenase
MAGMAASELGRRHGEHGILKYTEPQTIAIERGLPVGAPPWMRTDHYARVVSSGLRVLRRLPVVK